MNSEYEISLEDRLKVLNDLVDKSEFAIEENEISSKLEVNKEVDFIENIDLGTFSLEVAIRFSKFIQERFFVDGYLTVECMSRYADKLELVSTEKERIYELLTIRPERVVGRITRIYWTYDKNQNAYRFFGDFKYSDTPAAEDFKSRVQYVSNALFTLSYLKQTDKIIFITKILIEQVKNNLY